MVKQMAAVYEVIKEIQPHGPYHLVGYSFDGIIAYEMAYQLEQR